MTSCEDCRARLDAFLDGELEVGKGSSVGSHLDHCAECRDELEERRRLLARVRGARARHVAPELLRQTVTALLAEAENTTPVSRPSITGKV